MMKFILFKHLAWGGQGQNKAPAHACLSPRVREGRCACEGQERTQLEAAAQLSFPELRLKWSIWGHCWSVRCLCCPKTTELRLQHRGRRVRVTLVTVTGAGGKLASHREKLRKGCFLFFYFCSFSTDPGLAGVCLQPSRSVPHLLCRNYDVGRLCSHNKHHVPCAPIKLFSL